MLIVLNHKMNLNIDEIKEYEKNIREYDLVVMPQTPYMGLFTNGKYTLGSQCISEYTATGGVSAVSLVGMNVKYVLVGHFERRSILKDTDDVIVKKVTEALSNNIIPIMCIGEESNETHNEFEEMTKQIKNVFDNLSLALDKIIIAYEPGWNIGGESLPTSEKIINAVAFIKEYILNNYNVNIKVLYGGGINPDNIDSIKDLDIIDGVIIGNASLSIDNVTTLYRKIKK